MKNKVRLSKINVECSIENRSPLPLNKYCDDVVHGENKIFRNNKKNNKHTKFTEIGILQDFWIFPIRCLFVYV